MSGPGNATSRCGCSQGPTAVETVDATWSWRDWCGTARVRLGIGRMGYRVRPGLYATGTPEAGSPVFVTANYKLSFDDLRRAVRGIDAWLLVLDTGGVNVWCAAGKGTFSTAELCRRVEQTRLADRVSHRRLILPQLGAVGVVAHEVTKATGFRIEYGPVRAEDIPAWLAAGRRKDRAMRTVSFDLRDRLVLVPVELRNAASMVPVFIILAAVLAGLRVRSGATGFTALFSAYVIPLLGAVTLSAVAVPSLLPWLPTRSFALKGAFVGLAGALAVTWAASTALTHGGGQLEGASLWFLAAFQGGPAATGAVLVVMAIAAFVALNFTGASTFTSQSGTVLETRIALPSIVSVGAIGLVLQVVGAVRGGTP